MSGAEALPLEVWERVAYYTIARTDGLLGPPSEICTLCLICRWLYQAICFENNSGLYARLFRFKFDYDAVLRRLGNERLNTRCLAYEFRKRINVMKRVRRRDEIRVEDLWTCYLMMLENDGRNERQLIEWAHLYPYLQRAASIRFGTPPTAPQNWFRDAEGTSLILWLWWMMFSRDDLRIENPRIQDVLVRQLLHTFLVAGFRYPVFYGPESHFQFPLQAGKTAWSSSPPPPITEVEHFSRTLRVACPLLTTASLLVWAVRLETFRERAKFDLDSVSNLPLDRDQAIASNWRGPTQSDILHFYQAQIQAPEHCFADIRVSLDDRHPFRPDFDENITGFSTSNPKGSFRYDQDWYRMLSCCDPRTSSARKSDVYHLGSISGSWEGFYAQTSHDAHMALTINPQRASPESTALYRHPLYFTLQEHVCFEPDIPIGPGKDNFEGDDVLNAWLPRGLQITQLKDAIEVFDPNTQRNVRYETLVPDESVQGTESRLLACERSKKVCGLSRGLGSMEDNTEYVDAQFSHHVNGVADILVTGETTRQHGEAWGHYKIIGRVRSWDGIVVLLRTPRDQDQTHLGKWVFRGYIHDRNLVGHWRVTSTPANIVGYQGGFVVRNVS